MLLITVSAGAVSALVLGFVTGYCCGRRCRKDDGLSGRAGHAGMMPYPDTEYEYFEQRGGLARPVMLGHPSSAVGQPLLPQQASKLSDVRPPQPQEEVTYAEPELVTGLSHRGLGGGAPPSHLNLGSGVSPGLGGGPPPPRFNPVLQQGTLGSAGNPPLPGAGSHYSSSLLNPANKFNTIHSGGKRPLPSINQYESAAEAKLGSGKDPAYYARGRDNVNSYHMSTLGRSSSMRAKDPLLGGGGPVGGPRGGPSDLGGVGVGGGSGSNGSSSNDNSSAGKGQQVVDSAYGTTRSTKKVYL